MLAKETALLVPLAGLLVFVLCSSAQNARRHVDRADRGVHGLVHDRRMALGRTRVRQGGANFGAPLQGVIAHLQSIPPGSGVWRE